VKVPTCTRRDGSVTMYILGNDEPAEVMGPNP
jgi:hypothetical protein